MVRAFFWTHAMPWTSGDAEGHTKKADTDSLRKLWSEVANATRKRELADGASEQEADAAAVRAANAAVERAKHGAKEGLDMQTETIREFVDSRGVKLAVDREAGQIRGVKILGLESKNGRSYAKETAARAVGLYEGAKVNVNHPKGPASGPRDYQDRIGVLRNVRVEPGDGGLRADFAFNPKHALAEQLMWDAEHAPENVGFSHNVEARTSRKGGQTIVEEIVRVQSVDLVADPATTRGLFEEIETPTRKESTVEFAELTEADLKKHRPDLLKAIVETAMADRSNSETAKAAAAELKALKEEVATLKAEKATAETAAAVEKLLTEAKLPKELADLVRPQLTAAKDTEARKAIMESAGKAVKSLGGGNRPQSREQTITEGGSDLSGVKDAKSFTAAITE